MARSIQTNKPSDEQLPRPQGAAKGDLFTYADTKEPVYVFAQPGLPSEVQNSFATVVELRGGHYVRVGDDPPRRGIILVDPRTSMGKRYLKADMQHPSGWKVVSYTYLRACIYRTELIDTDEFEGVAPIFEIDWKALKIHIHEGLKKTLEAESKYADLKFTIAKYGGNSSYEAKDAQVILALPQDVKELRELHAHAPIHVESGSWIQASIRRGRFTFSEGMTPGATPSKTISMAGSSPGKTRHEYYYEEEKELVKFLAEYYPKERDRGRASMRAYEHIAKHPNQYPWGLRHSAASWQNHFAKNLPRLEMLIERYLESHPDLIVSESEAERKRDDKMGKQRRKSTAMRARDADEDDEAPSPKKRRIVNQRKSVVESDDDISEGEEPSKPWPRKTRSSSARMSKGSPAKAASTSPKKVRMSNAIKEMPPDGASENGESDEDQLHDDEPDDSFPPVREAPPPALEDVADEPPRGGDRFTRALRGTQPNTKPNPQSESTPVLSPPASPSTAKIRQSSRLQSGLRTSPRRGRSRSQSAAPVENGATGVPIRRGSRQPAAEAEAGPSRRSRSRSVASNSGPRKPRSKAQSKTVLEPLVEEGVERYPTPGIVAEVVIPYRTTRAGNRSTDR